jgi:hypothetical protein
LVMKIPLKTADRQFTLYKLVVMPSRISGNKFVQYQPDFSYLAVSYNRRDYLLLDEAHVQLCTSGSITICPSVTALYDVQTVSCEASLFFQYKDGHRVCRRLLLDYDLPTLQRHGGVCIYHFPDRHQVSIRCPRGVTHSEVLHDAGIIHGATSCSIATSNVRTLPELHGTAGIHSDTPDVYLPDLPPILTAHELPQFEQTASVKTDGIDSIQRHLAASPRLLDIDTMLHVHQTFLSGEAHAYLEWILPSSTVACCLVLILFHLPYTTQSLCTVLLRIEESRVKPRTPGLCVSDCVVASSSGRQRVRKFAKSKSSRLHELQLASFSLNKRWLIMQTQTTRLASKDGLKEIIVRTYWLTSVQWNSFLLMGKFLCSPRKQSPVSALFKVDVML